MCDYRQRFLFWPDYHIGQEHVILIELEFKLLFRLRLGLQQFCSGNPATQHAKIRPQLCCDFGDDLELRISFTIFVRVDTSSGDVNKISQLLLTNAAEIPCCLDLLPKNDLPAILTGGWAGRSL